MIYPSLIDQIVDRIYIGCYQAATDLGTSNPEGITTVLNCTPDPHVGLLELNVRQLNIHDGRGMSVEDMWFGINTIKNAIAAGGKILVHCHAGISRSPSLVIAYLMTCGLSWDEGLNLVSKRRPLVLPHPAITRSIKKNLGYLIDPTTSMFGEYDDI